MKEHANKEFQITDKQLRNETSKTVSDIGKRETEKKEKKKQVSKR